MPAFFSLRPDRSTRVIDDGSALLGGSPLRLFRLSGRAGELVERWLRGDAVGPARAAGLLARRLVSGGVMTPRSASARFGREDVTVVVPVRDRPAELDRLLGALGGLACVVVDDASRQADAIGQVAEHHGAQLVALADNVGPSGARNAGLATVRSALVAFVDSDCAPSDGWLEPLLSHFDDPLVAAVAPRIVAAGVEAGPTLSRYEATRSPLDRGTRPSLVRPRGPVPFVPSATLVMRSDLATGPDLFDPALRGGEDVDLVWRLGEAGWDVRYEPTSTVRHHGAATLGRFLARQAFYGSTAGALARRHPGAVPPAELSVWTFAACVLALARRPWLAIGTVAVSVALLARRLSGLVDRPGAVAARVAGGGTACGAVATLGGLSRVWSPALALALAFRRTRRIATAGLLLPALADWVSGHRTLDPVRYAALHVADDTAYGMGVWAGCLRARVIEPLLPRVVRSASPWSGRALRADPEAPAVPRRRAARAAGA